MTPEQALGVCRLAKTLSPAQAVDEYTPDAWALVLKNVNYADAMTALEALGGEQEWIHVSHIVKRVKRIRKERVDRYLANVSAPSGMSDAEYDDWYRRTVKAIADGDYQPAPPRAIGDTGARERKILELGKAGESVNTALGIQSVREAHEEARRRKQAAEAEARRAEGERRAERERVRREAVRERAKGQHPDHANPTHPRPEHESNEEKR